MPRKDHFLRKSGTKENLAKKPVSRASEKGPKKKTNISKKVAGISKKTAGIPTRKAGRMVGILKRTADISKRPTY